ncbi:MAG: hypothetical protein ACJ8GN_24935 [Longimicrobiaceae bacterium]
MTRRGSAALLPLAAALLAACGGSGGGRAAAADTAAVQKVWTPDQARALREARERGEPGPATVVPVQGLADAEDSARWMAEEKVKYDERVRSMDSYVNCMAQARAADGELRARIEEGCRRLPTAPR